jgi:hypothetical protein
VQEQWPLFVDLFTIKFFFPYHVSYSYVSLPPTDSLVTRENEQLKAKHAAVTSEHTLQQDHQNGYRNALILRFFFCLLDPIYLQSVIIHSV